MKPLSQVEMIDGSHRTADGYNLGLLRPWMHPFNLLVGSSQSLDEIVHGTWEIFDEEEKELVAKLKNVDPRVKSLVDHYVQNTFDTLEIYYILGEPKRMFGSMLYPAQMLTALENVGHRMGMTNSKALQFGEVIPKEKVSYKAVQLGYPRLVPNGLYGSWEKNLERVMTGDELRKAEGVMNPFIPDGLEKTEYLAVQFLQRNDPDRKGRRRPQIREPDAALV